MQILRLRRIHARVPLRNDDDAFFFAEGVNELDRALASNCKRQNRVRKQNRVSNRQNRKNPIVAAFPVAGVAGLNHADEIASHECPYIK
jgi:hypothetical protein